MLSLFPLSSLSGWRDKLTGSLNSRRVRIVELISLITFLGPAFEALSLDEVELIDSIEQCEAGLL